MIILLEIFLVIVILAIIVCFIMLAFDMSIPEIIEWYEKRRNRTADIDLVRHGHWIDIDPESYIWKVRCSECSNERSMMSTQGRHPKYCEECGAKMDEVEE